jgi:SnoaL-like domain
MNAKDIVDAYWAAWEAKDLDTARKYLADSLDFAGPIDTFNNADDYIKAIAGLSHIVTSTTTRRVFADGSDVAVFYDMHTSTPAGTAPIAEWFSVHAGRISMIRVYFDAWPFTRPVG